MDVSDIDLFLIVTEHQSLRRAAETARLSQPTLTRRIQALEASYGTALFTHHGRGIQLTAAGALLRTRLMPLRRHFDAIREEVAAAAVDAGGDVSLGLPPSLRVLLARRVVGRFCNAHPAVTVRLTEETRSVISSRSASLILRSPTHWSRSPGLSCSRSQPSRCWSSGPDPPGLTRRRRCHFPTSPNSRSS